MLRWSAIFFVIALISGFFGFGGISSTASDIARILFYLFLIGFAITLIAGLFVTSKIK